MPNLTCGTFCIMNSEKNVFGVPLTDTPINQLFTAAFDAIEQGRPYHIVTVNAEILMEASRDAHYAAVLRQAHARPVESGPRLVMGLRHRIAGVDAAEELVRLGIEQGKRIVFLLRSDGRTSLELMQQSIDERFPGGDIIVLSESSSREPSEDLVNQLRALDPDIILCGFGAPNQEYYLNTLFIQYGFSSIMMGVGGTFDFWSGIAHRAPRLFRLFHIEWLWRLFREPRRIKRIFTAVVLFPIYAWIDR